MKLLSLLALVAISLSLAEGAMVCYFGSWSVYRHGDGKFDVEDIDPSICTHLIFGFAGLNPSTYEIKVLDPYNELCENWGKCAYDRFTKLKEKNIYLKALLGVGGWNEGSSTYSTMSADPSKRKMFIESSIKLLKAHDFDGLDLDWEYPTQRGGKPEDYENYITLLSELSTALHAEGMLLTAAVSAGKGTIDAAYNIPAMVTHLDIINLMTYDMHGAWDHYTHHQSPLYAHPDDTGDNLFFNVDYAVHYWLDNGAPKDKLVVGMPLYGRCWSLDSDADTGFYAPASQPGNPGPWTGSPGFMGYNEICSEQMTQSWTVVNDPAMHEPYAYYLPNHRLWCSYEDVDSVTIKAQYAKDLGLAGCMVWSVETDDFKGVCHGQDFPLINTIVDVFSGGIHTKPPTAPPPSTVTMDPTATTVIHTMPPSPSPSEHCSKPGPNADEEDCTHYYLCTQGDDGYIEFEQECPPNTLFNPLAYICDWPESVCHLEGDHCPNDCPSFSF